MSSVLVVGVGSMGWNHARVCSELGILVGICDADKEKLETVSNHFGVPGFFDLDTALSELNPEGVIIATNTSSHYSLTKKVLEMGHHVLVEKPIVDKISQGEELVSIAETSGLVLAVGHIERHNPVIKRAKFHLDEGDWGELITLNARRVSPFTGRINDVGAILDTGIHDIDNLLYLMDSNPVNVYASGGSFNQIEFEDHANIVVNFENGKSGVIEVNWITPMKVRTLSLTCENCFVELDYIKQQFFVSKSSFAEIDSPRLYPSQIEFNSNKINLNKEEPLRLEIEDFVNSIEGGGKPLVGGAQALLSLKVAIAAVKSLNNHEVVNIE